MMGAGSAVFVKNLLTDILNFTELGRVVISLHDIDPERLETGGMMARWTAQQFGADAVIEEHLDRRRALEGCDFVINMVQIGMHEATLLDFDIPRSRPSPIRSASAASSAACAPSPSCSISSPTCASSAPTRCC